MKIYALIPAYNEADSIADVIEDIKKKVDAVVVVDDGSSDGTSQKAKESGAIVLRHILNRGQGAALRTGMEYALKNGADILITFDADGQHDSNDIPKLTEPLWSGHFDVVLGSRFLSQKSKIPFRKCILLKFATFFTRLSTGLKVTDTHNGLRAFSRQCAQTIQIRQDDYAHASEILEEIAKYELRYKEVPTAVYYTDYSMKKGQSLFNSFRIMWDIILGRLNR